MTEPTLSIPDVTDDVLAAALAYAKAGLYVVPVERGTKNPGSVLGKDWQTKSSRDAEVIVSWLAGTDHGIALHCGRSGVLALDVDKPDLVPGDVAEAVAGAPFQSTNATVPGRGHYLFRADTGYGNTSGIPGCDVRGENGVILLAPTVHPGEATGGRYAWTVTGALPDVPEAVRTRLSGSQTARDAATDGEVSRFRTEHVRADRPGLLAPVLDRFAAQTAAGSSRHDAAVSCAAQVAREARAGCYRAGDAFEALRQRFTAAMTAPNAGRQLDARQAADEFAGIVAWSVAQANATDADDERRKIEERTRPALVPVATLGSLPNLPDQFWTSRPVLGQIRQAAHASCVSADLVVHCVLARLASMVSPIVRVDTGIAPASLNYFVAVVGEPGAGKSLGVSVAQRLVTVPDGLAFGDRFRDGVPLGSGEGLAESFMGDAPDADNPKRRTRAKVRDNVLIYADEGQTIAKQSQRDGATTMQALRSGWVGQLLGQSNASKETTRIVPDGTYSLGLIVGYQPSAVADLLADADGGTPQRFMFCSAVDPSISSDPVEWPGRIEGLPTHTAFPDDFRAVMSIADPAITKAIRAEHIARQRGHAAPVALFDTHKPLHLAKTSALLAILDGRRSVNAEDWRLASVLWDTSCAVRGRLAESADEKRAEQEHARTDAAVVREQRLSLARDEAGSNRERVAKLIAGYVHDGKADTRYKARRALKSSDRGIASEAIDYAEQCGWIEAGEGDEILPGMSQPAA